MSDVKKQVHGKFKAFAAVLDDTHPFAALAQQVTDWVSHARVAPKSIGVEFLEAREQLVLTVGYRDDEPAYAVQIRAESLGNLADLTADGLGRLEKKMEDVSARLPDVICHELYVTAKHECFMVFLVHE